MPSTRMDSRVEGLEKQMEQINAEIQRSNSDHNEQLRSMGTTMEDFHRDFEEMRTLMKELMKQKTIMTEDHQTGSSNFHQIPLHHEHTHSTHFEGDVSETFKEALKKVELPTFDGNDPIGWLARTEKFFEIQNTNPEVKISLAFVCMEGPAVHWFRYLKKRLPDMNWEIFKSELLK